MSAAGQLNSLLAPLSRCLDRESALRLLDFRIDPAVAARIEILATGANEGTLSEDEMAEYKLLIETADFVDLLKLQARKTVLSAA